ncbi:hypothetical protein CPC16_011739 [Podila verticillata]|nr:hypothetical protein CPC16_011739 [Podila verticillata]
MDNGKQEAIYCRKTSTDPESLSFIVHLATTPGNQEFEFTSQLCSFVVRAKETSDNKYKFIIHTSESNSLTLTRFRKYSVTNPKNTINGNFIYSYFGEYKLSELIERDKLIPNAGCFELRFCFTEGSGSIENLPNHSTLQPSFPRIIVERLFYEPIGVDVTFVCDDVLKEDCPSKADLAIIMEQASILSEVETVAVVETSNQSQAIIEKRGSAGSSNTNKVDSRGSITSTTSTFGAHKVVLAQWPYFKSMFSSEFIEGGSGMAPIRIKDVNAKTFREMIYFMYVGEVESDSVELLKSHDPIQAAKVSWEALYLAADRYQIDDLRKLALNKITGNLKKMETIEFLFRSAYLFEELRTPVIAYIAKVHHSEVAKKKTREKYMDHPEFCELLGELLILTILLSTSTTEKQRFELSTDLGTFVLFAKESDIFKINTAKTDLMLLSEYKQCSISSLSKERLATGSVLYRYFWNYEIDVSVERDQQDVQEGCAELQF